MFRRFSLFDAPPPAGNVAISNQKIIPSLVHSEKVNSGCVAEPLGAGYGSSDLPSVPESRAQTRTSPIAIRNNRNINEEIRPIPTSPSPSRPPVFVKRHSTGSAPNPTFIQQQIQAAQIYMSSKRNSCVVNSHQNGINTARREHYKTSRSISTPESPSQPPHPLSSSLPSAYQSKHYFGSRCSPTWYAKFSHSLRRNIFRRSVSSINNNVIVY